MAWLWRPRILAMRAMYSCTAVRVWHTAAAWAPPRLASWLGLEMSRRRLKMSRRGRWRLGRLARQLEMSAWTLEAWALGCRLEMSRGAAWRLEMERECVCGVTVTTAWRWSRVGPWPVGASVRDCYVPRWA